MLVSSPEKPPKYKTNKRKPTRDNHHYDNILMVDPIGLPIARIARIKADWYVAKGVAREFQLSEACTDGHIDLTLRCFNNDASSVCST